MKYVILIIQVCLLFSLLWIGEWISHTLHLMIPGSVIGLILLFLLLITGIIKERYIKTGAQFMMQHLVLFFIPATVGIINYIGLFKGKGMWLIVITVVSTILVMAISGYVSQIIHQWRGKKNA